MPPTRTRKRDASLASIRLGRNNCNQPSLLSTFRTDPATDDEPLSSTDEENQPASPASSNDGCSKYVSNWSARDLDVKLAEGDRKEEEDDHNRTPTRTPTSKTRKGSRVAVKRGNDETPQTAVKKRKESRGNKLEDDSDEGKWAFGMTANQRRNRNNRNTYGGRKLYPQNIHARQTKNVKPPIRSPDKDDHAVHSPAEKRNVPVFRELGEIPLEGVPSSSLPTDVNSTIFDPDASTSSCSSPPSSLVDPEEKPVPKFMNLSRCPMCEEILDDDFVKSHPTKGLTVRKQMQYCRAHKIWTAKKEWAEKKYPTIDWVELSERIEGYLSSLEDILMLKKQSGFRKKLENSKEGQRENIRLTAWSKGLDMMSTGYYGPRGSKLM